MGSGCRFAVSRFSDPLNSPSHKRPPGGDLSHARILASYGQVAREAGLDGRARLVGRLLRDLPRGSDLPWHRVLNAAGKSSLDPASASGRRQRRRLEAEGVSFEATGRVNLKRFGWQPDA